MSKLTKKLSIGIILLSLCGFNEYVYAMEESIDKNEMRVWEKSVLEDINSETPIGDWKTMDRAAHGGWTWRDGVICISDSYAITPHFNNGHAGIVAADPYYYATIEANPGTGVQVVYGNWTNRFSGSTVYQIGVKKQVFKMIKMLHIGLLDKSENLTTMNFSILILEINFIVLS